jgi:hypothetical protein
MSSSNNPGNTRVEMLTAAATAAVAALVAITAYGRWPYDYYELFRWIICAGSSVAGYMVRSRPIALIACVAVAVAFNPIAPMRMRAYEWRNYDIAATVAMGVVAIYAWRLRNATNGPQGGSRS